MQVDFSGDRSIASLRGDFTFTDHAAFLDMIHDLVESTSPTVVIDLSKLDFIDSAGLGMLLITRDEASKASRKLILRAPRGQVKRMFDVTKFSSMFTVEP